jgi:hypothetical protein
MSTIVLCKLQHGIVLEQDGQVVQLDYGFNDDADVELVQTWLNRNSNLACVRDGDISIVGDGAVRKARDIKKQVAA